MDFQLMLAPMEGITNLQFRALCHRNGADLTFTEVARVGNLAKSKRGELEKIVLDDTTPTQIQLAGAKLFEYEKFLAKFKPQEMFRGFNLNLGCPSPEYIKQGTGAAMMKRVSRVSDIVGLINKAGYECSVKMRLGMNDQEKRDGAYLNLISNVDASFFAVHARTAKQTERDSADFSVYAKCLETGKRIVANGDITTRAQITDLKKMGLVGAMIGRGARDDPSIFKELKAD